MPRDAIPFMGTYSYPLRPQVEHVKEFFLIMLRFLIGVAVGIYIAQEFPEKVPKIKELLERGLSKLRTGEVKKDSSSKSTTEKEE